MQQEAIVVEQDRTNPQNDIVVIFMNTSYEQEGIALPDIVRYNVPKKAVVVKQDGSNVKMTKFWSP